MNADELKQVLEKHSKWLRNEDGCIFANLSNTNLRNADLSGANLSGADLRGTDLRGTNLRSANLSGANLRRADLRDANLRSADLSDTVLDPDKEPNADVAGFANDGAFLIGYRTRTAGHIDKYRDGRYYSADVFSVCDAECHPGLYLWPTIAAAREWAPTEEIIRVRTKPTEVHHAGSKWRCRWFEVMGTVSEKESK